MGQLWLDFGEFESHKERHVNGCINHCLLQRGTWAFAERFLRDIESF